jgi:hypothetical protein
LPILEDDCQSALSVFRLFRDLARVPDRNACYPGIVWHPRTAARVFLTLLQSHSLQELSYRHLSPVAWIKHRCRRSRRFSVSPLCPTFRDLVRVPDHNLCAAESFGAHELKLVCPSLFFAHTSCENLPTAIRFQLPGWSIVSDSPRRLSVSPLYPIFQRPGSGSRSQRLLPRSHSVPTNLRPRVPHSSSITLAVRAFLPLSVSSYLDRVSWPMLPRPL